MSPINPSTTLSDRPTPTPAFNNKDRVVFTLSDECIAVLSRLLQIALLTNTNVVDHMRQLKVEESSEQLGTLVPTPEYNAWFDSMIQKMLQQAEAVQHSAPKASSILQ